MLVYREKPKKENKPINTNYKSSNSYFYFDKISTRIQEHLFCRLNSILVQMIVVGSFKLTYYYV